MTLQSYAAIYDFELLPYALGDVLTWNTQTAIQCAELGRERVDVHVCLDRRTPASIYQQGTISADNCELYFSELFGAFGTHPMLGNIQIYRRREELLERLREIADADAAIREPLADYEQALASRDDNDVLVSYFTKYIYFHERINAYAEAHGEIPWLAPSIGCEPDVAGLVERLFAGKKIVAIHFRLRRLDAGLGGDHTYHRDSDFLEWYEFLREAQVTHPDVQFILLGRLQEKPLKALDLPNVTSLRLLGFGLGHELTMMLRSDLFIGTSSGFAAMANFSTVPHFITHMNDESCNAYGIAPGAERLPFARPGQILVYERESKEMLTRLLDKGLDGVAARPGIPVGEPREAINIDTWAAQQARWLHPDAMTSRYFTHDNYSDRETAFLLWPRVKEALDAARAGSKTEAAALARRIELNFPGLGRQWPEFVLLKSALSPGAAAKTLSSRVGWSLRLLRGRAWRGAKRAARATLQAVARARAIVQRGA
jgi:hypothetical protein